MQPWCKRQIICAVGTLCYLKIAILSIDLCRLRLAILIFAMASPSQPTSAGSPSPHIEEVDIRPKTGRVESPVADESMDASYAASSHSESSADSGTGACSTRRRRQRSRTGSAATAPEDGAPGIAEEVDDSDRDEEAQHQHTPKRARSSASAASGQIRPVGPLATKLIACALGSEEYVDTFNETNPTRGNSVLQCKSQFHHVIIDGKVMLMQALVMDPVGSFFPNRVWHVGWRHDFAQHISYPVFKIFIARPTPISLSRVTEDNISASAAADSTAATHQVIPNVIDPFHPPPDVQCTFRRSDFEAHASFEDLHTHVQYGPVEHIAVPSRDRYVPVLNSLQGRIPTSSTMPLQGSVVVHHCYHIPPQAHTPSTPDLQEYYFVPSTVQITVTLETSHLRYEATSNTTRREVVSVYYPTNQQADTFSECRRDRKLWEKWPQDVCASAEGSVALNYEIPRVFTFLRFEYDNVGRRDRKIRRWFLQGGSNGPYQSRRMGPTERVELPSQGSSIMYTDTLDTAEHAEDWVPYRTAETLLKVTTVYWRRGPGEGDGEVLKLNRF
eukprot:m.48253 g.48253  ORF g.48253 m.48253 type:complete len:557 (+) comp6023_c0_seq1:293-1963(+)